ncbi:chromosome condensation complex Condensin, subunit G, partial [Linderina pennispora]
AIADIIRKLSINEQDFIRIMVEVVSDVRELGAANEPEDAENARLEALLVSIKCLIIIKYILQRCFDALSEGSSMYGLLTECVVPAVQSSESVLQEYGIECLALCCLLDKNMAVDNIGLFAQAVRQGAGELHSKGLAAMLDLSFLYGVRELAPSVGSVEEFMEVLYLELESESLAVQATVAEGIARLLYARRIPEPAAVLEELLVLYYHPSTVNNYKLRQCLTYFFPAYSYITPENQQQMRDVAIEAICRLSNLLKQTATADAQSTATPGQVVQQLVAWTDPRIFEAIYAMNNNAPIRSTTRMDGFVKLGIDALKRTFRAPHNTRKVLVQMLNKLGLDDATPMIQTQELFVLARALADKQLITDMITKNALHRFETLLLKLLDVDKVEDATMEAWREEPEMASVFEFLAV